MKSVNLCRIRASDMKIFRSDQIRAIDEFTIKNEPISSTDLMERAAMKLFSWIVGRFGRTEHFIFFTGPGNNGGDGLALARMLSRNEYSVEVYYVNISEKRSADWEVNLHRLEHEANINVVFLNSADQFPSITSDDIIIDGIFGSGLTRNVTGLAGEIIRKINSSDYKLIISIDIPSGLFGEDNKGNSYDNVIKANFTLSFQFPKLSFMFADNDPYLGEWHILPIGLHPDAILNISTPYYYMENEDILTLLNKRKKFDHKGTFGHGLLISGSFGKMGAAVLGAGAAMRTGIGLITCHVPSCGNIIMQCSIPEAMVSTDKSDRYISSLPELGAYDAIGIGPGLGTEPETMKAVHHLLAVCKKPLVIDADALNILSKNKDWLSMIPAGAVLTPHIKEFERLTGKTWDCFSRLHKQQEFSTKYNCIVVLKGAHTSVSSPENIVQFNSTGNPGMATAGSGDVLTGIILSLLAQGYNSYNAAVIGVYLHGVAGDAAAGKSSFESIIASDIINSIGEGFNKIRETEL
jgi:hydroxyethylthiazole kinase-like uncharacterized protein yjeF